MKVTKFQLIIALLTFGVGVLSVYLSISKSYPSAMPITELPTQSLKEVITPNLSFDSDHLEIKLANTVSNTISR